MLIKDYITETDRNKVLLLLEMYHKNDTPLVFQEGTFYIETYDDEKITLFNDESDMIVDLNYFCWLNKLANGEIK